ncbi:MAG: hypothetical protein AB1500_06060 [Bacillota bacterium]
MLFYRVGLTAPTGGIITPVLNAADRNGTVNNGVSPAQTPPEKRPVSDQGVGVSRGEESEKVLKRLGVKECQTCKQRQYRDVSNDPGVSFKSPTHVSPEAAYMAVSAHEQEHVLHAQARAELEGREIVYQNVQISTSVCPECGRVYVSGGKTTTVTRKAEETAPPQTTPGLIVDKRA